MTQRTTIKSLINEVAAEDHAFDRLEEEVQTWDHPAVSDALLDCGIIPESFTPSSSEEKLWAKYCDILVARAFSLLGIPSEVLRTRGDSADFRGVLGHYRIVGDAKAFRLSRTAKNQKDFKVQALNDWRREDDFATLVGPLSQYPTTSSQIYSQAKRCNVTLFSYVHLRFLLDHEVTADLASIWEAPCSLEPNKSAVEYWQRMDDAAVAVTGVTFAELHGYKREAEAALVEVGEEGIRYWHGVEEILRTLSHEEAIQRVIEAEGLHAKIATIRKSLTAGITL